MLTVYCDVNGEEYKTIKNICKKILLREINNKYYDKISLRDNNNNIILNININDYERAYQLLMEYTVYNVYIANQYETLHIYTNPIKKESVRYINNYVKNINNDRNIHIYLISDNCDNDLINDSLLWYHIDNDGKIIEIINHNKDLFEKVYESHRENARFKKINIIIFTLLLLFAFFIYIIYVFTRVLLIHD